MTLSAWATLVTVWIAAIMSPGPDVFAIIQQARHRQSYQCAAGVMTGNIVWITATLAGVGALATRFPGFFTTLRWIGVGFLAFYGGWIIFKVLVSLRDSSDQTTMVNIDEGQASSPVDSAETTKALKSHKVKAGYMIGLATNALNPKALLFYVALFASLIPSPLPFATGAAITVVMVLVGAAWFFGVAALAQWGPLFNFLQHHGRIVDTILGILLVFFSAMLAYQMV